MGSPCNILEAYDLGLPVFPVGNDKKPLGPWEKYQTERPTREEVEAWAQDPRTSVAYGIPGGPQSGVCIVDTDNADAEMWARENLPKTLMVKTKKGMHRYYRWPSNVDSRHLRNRTGVYLADGTRIVGLDVRADGGYVVGPGSEHPAGGRYEAIGNWTAEALSQIPAYDPIAWWGPFAGMRPESRPVAAEPVPQPMLTANQAETRYGNWLSRRPSPAVGCRNNETYSAACVGYDFGLEASTVLELLSAWNHSHPNPLPDHEVQQCVESAGSSRQAPMYPKGALVANAGPSAPRVRSAGTSGTDGAAGGGSSEGDDEKVSAFSRALSKVEDRFEFFSDNGVPYLSPGKGLALALDGGDAKKQIVLHLYRSTGSAPSTDVVQKIVDLKSAEVVLEGPYCPVYRRVGEKNSVYFLDACRPDGKVFAITAQGWTLDDAPAGIYFRRSGSADEELPEPMRGGDVLALGKLINAPTETIRFMIGYLVAAIRPGRPYPLLVIEGGAGSAKTSATKILKFMIDPERAMASSLPRTEQDLAIACHSSHVLVLDNVDRLKPDQQDALCRVATGAHYKSRKLYADAEQTALSMHAPVIMSGLEGLVDRADLASRVALAQLDSITEDKRITEAELWARATELRPQILGGVLDAFCAALANVDSVKLERRPRMIDFALFATAAETALPWETGEILRFFLDAQLNLNDQALAKDRVALAIVSLMRHRDNWSGTVGELMDTLEPPPGGEDFWPSTIHKLARRVVAAIPLLESKGIGFRRGARQKNGVLFHFFSKRESTLSTPMTAELGNTGGSGVNFRVNFEGSKYTKYTEATTEAEQIPADEYLRDFPL